MERSVAAVLAGLITLGGCGNNANNGTTPVGSISSTESSMSSVPLPGTSVTHLQCATHSEFDYSELYDTHQSADGYFINFGDDAYDWAYIPTDLQSGFKLEGLDETKGCFLWSPIFGFGIESFDSVSLSSSPLVQLCFGGAASTTTAIEQLQSQCHTIKGVFSHYADGAFDWVYGSLLNNQAYKLDGMDAQTGFLQWTPINGYYGRVDISLEGLTIFAIAPHSSSAHSSAAYSSMTSGANSSLGAPSASASSTSPHRK